MSKKLLGLISLLLCLMLIVGLFSGCGSKESEDTSQTPSAEETETVEEKPEESEAEESVDVPEYEETTEETIADRDYRNALKRFQGKEESPAKTESRPQKMSDNAYREALRAMKRKK